MVTVLLTKTRKRSDLAFLRSLFDIHILEFAGLEDFAAFLALDELRILVPANDLHARMLARLLGFRGWRRSGRLWGHKSGRFPQETHNCGAPFLPEFPPF
jgi:hypothetical protein